MGFDLFILVLIETWAVILSVLLWMRSAHLCLPCICAQTPRRSLASSQTSYSTMNAPIQGIQQMFPEYRPSQKHKIGMGVHCYSLRDFEVQLYSDISLKRECTFLFNCETEPSRKYPFLTDSILAQNRAVIFFRVRLEI